MIYKDAKQPIINRVNDLMGRMTLEEKIAQLKAILPQMILDSSNQTIDLSKLKKFGANGLGRIPQFSMPFIDSAKSVAKAYNTIQKYFIEETRLGIPFLTQVECLNGLVAADAAAFPAPILLASTWEPSLIQQAAEVINKQMVAIGMRFGLAPVVDLAREPRWGRVYETYGEDKYLASQMGVAYSKGLQKPDLKQSAISCAKHFLGYSTTLGGLNVAEVTVNERELYDQFATPFEAMIKENDIQGIMCTYSAINSRPVSISKPILTDLLRDKMGFGGTAVCDGGSIEMAYDRQRAVPSMKAAAIEALKAGLDTDAPVTVAFNYLAEAVEKNELDVSYIDNACRRVLTQKFELGLFDNPYVEIDKVDQAFDNTEHEKLSKKLSDEGIILVKNNGILPLKKNIKKIAIIGPHGNNVVDLFAGYSYASTVEMIMDMLSGKQASMTGVTDQPSIKDAAEIFTAGQNSSIKGFDINTYIREKYHAKTIVESLKDKSKVDIVYARGCNIDDDNQSMFDEALKVAANADVIIYTMGGKCGWSSNSTSGEGKDRASLDLPGVQEKLMKTLQKLNKPSILVLFHGRPMTITWANENMDAILDVWFTGPQGSESIADILVGNVNPSGKLPVTVPKTIGQIPLYYNHPAGSGYERIKSANNSNSPFDSFFGGGYTDLKVNEPLYAFGHGLSYTDFKYDNLTFSDLEIDVDGKIEISVDITNVGKIEGKEIVQFYTRDEEAYITRPLKELVGFHKTELLPNQTKRITLTLDMHLLGFTNENDEFVVEPGTISMMVGSSSKDIRLRNSFKITGEVKNIQKTRAYISQTRESIIS